MRMKRKPENYMLQIGHYVYDYAFDDGKEYIIVGLAHNLKHYSVYYSKYGGLKLVKTTMNKEEIIEYANDLDRNYAFILREGRDERLLRRVYLEKRGYKKH